MLTTILLLTIIAALAAIGLWLLTRLKRANWMIAMQKAESKRLRIDLGDRDRSLRKANEALERIHEQRRRASAAAARKRLEKAAPAQASPAPTPSQAPASKPARSRKSGGAAAPRKG